MRIHDITVPLYKGMTVYRGDPEFGFEERLRIRKGASCNLGVITMGLHNGTHFDAPYHINEKGTTFDHVPVEKFFGKALVVGIEDKESIKPADVAGLALKGAKSVLFKTANSLLLEKQRPFKKDFVHLTPEAAEILGRKHKVSCVGIDYLSVDRFHSGAHPAHHALLKHGILILETINLFHVRPGFYEFFAGALLIRDADAGPARVFLKGPVR